MEEMKDHLVATETGCQMNAAEAFVLTLYGRT